MTQQLISALQKRNKELSDEAYDAKQDLRELKSFLENSIYPVLENQTAMNIAALEALHNKLNADEEEEKTTKEIKGQMQLWS